MGSISKLENTAEFLLKEDVSITHRKYPKVWWKHNRRKIYSKTILKNKYSLDFRKHI